MVGAPHVKKGPLLRFVDTSRSWEICYVVVRQKTLEVYDKENGIIISSVGFDDSWTASMLELLPDDARASRFSKIFPFTVQGGQLAEPLDGSRITGPAGKSSITLACLATVDVWDWAQAVRYRGSTPNRSPLPHDAVYCSYAAHMDDHHVVPLVLQERILASLRYEKDDDFRDFLVMVLRGACIHGALKNFELVLSTPIDLELNRVISNSPLAMTLEGDYSPWRTYMVETLLKHNSGIGRGFGAGPDATCSHVLPLAKPQRFANFKVACACGSAVHPDDKALIRHLVECGDMVEFNEKFEQSIIAASKRGLNTVNFNGFDNERGMTKLNIPEGIMSWAIVNLQHLNISDNFLSLIPEALFDLANLVSLDVSKNCLLSLSASIKRLTKLEKFLIGDNLLESLPEELIDLPRLIDRGNFRCLPNPLVTPPVAVASKGLHAIVGFFRDGQEAGVQTNTALKVLVLGLSEAGKTSLINGLVEKKARVTRQGDRTVGIEQRMWSITGQREIPVGPGEIPEVDIILETDENRELTVGDRVQLSPSYEASFDAADGPLTESSEGMIIDDLKGETLRYKVRTEEGRIWRYAIGALVRAANESGQWKLFHEGETLQVKSFKTAVLRVDNPDGRTVIPANMLEPFTQGVFRATILSVGDSVKLGKEPLLNDDDLDFLANGALGLVVAISFDAEEGPVYLVTDAKGRGVWCTSTDVERSNEKFVRLYFAPGDVVRVVGPRARGFTDSVTVAVFDRDDDDRPYKVQDTSGDTMWLPRNALEADIPILNIGDIVVVTRSIGHMLLRKGDTARIISWIEEDGVYKLRGSCGSVGNFKREDIGTSRQAWTMRSFEVGKSVILKQNAVSLDIIHGPLGSNDVGRVVDDDGSVEPVVVTTFCDSKWRYAPSAISFPPSDRCKVEAPNGRSWYYSTDFLEETTTPFEKSTEEQLSLGAVVSLDANFESISNSSEGPLKLDDIGLVEEFDIANDLYRVRHQDGRTFWYRRRALHSSSGTFELKRILEVGDSVCLSSNYKSFGDAELGPLRLGKVGRVTDIQGRVEIVSPQGLRWWYDTAALVKTDASFMRLSPYEINLKVFDFAGQQEYYLTHHVFLTSRALYIIAFNLAKYTAQTARRHIGLWLSNIQNRSPGAKVILVGTHADMLGATKAEEVCHSVMGSLTDRSERLKKLLIKEYDTAKKQIDERDKVIAASLASARILLGMEPKSAGNEAKSEEEVEIFSKLKQSIADGFDGDGDKLSQAVQLISTFQEDSLQRSILSAHVSRVVAQQRSVLTLPTEIIAISSKDLYGIEKLRIKVEEAVQDSSQFPSLFENIPKSYFKVIDFIQQRRDTLPVMTSCDYAHLCARELDLPIEVVERATDFAHEVGDVLYYKDINVVFLQVRFLVDVFKYLIRHDHHEATQFDSKYPVADGMTLETFDRAKDAFIQRGQLSVSLLKRLWADLKLSNDVFLSIVSMLEKFEIGIVTSQNESGPLQLLVPSFFQEYLPVAKWPKECSEEFIQLHRWFMFSDTPPEGVMQRLQVHLCRQAHQYFFAREGAIIYIGDVSVLCRQTDSAQYNTPSPMGIDLIARGPSTAIVWPIFSRIMHILDALLRYWPGLSVQEYAIRPLKEGPSDCFALEKLVAFQKSGLREILCSDQSRVNLEFLIEPPQPEISSRGTVVDSEKAVGSSATEFSEPSVLQSHANALGDSDTQDFGEYYALVRVYRRDQIPWVMLSYQWDLQLLAIRIFRALSNRNIPVWMDIMGGMTGDVYTSMAQGVEGSVVVCPIVSKRYETSENCKSELQYTRDAKRAIVPIKAELFNPSSWLGVIIAGLLWIDITSESDDATFSKRIEDLVRELSAHGVVEHRVDKAVVTQVMRKRLSVQTLATPVHSAAPIAVTEPGVIDILHSLKIEQTTASKYAGELKKIGVDCVDHLFYLDDIALNDVNMLLIHKRMLMAWVRQKSAAVS